MDVSGELWKFLNVFFHSKGCVRMCLVSLLTALAIGSIVGLVPQVVSDRYARISHGYFGSPCNEFHRSNMPEACQKGSDESQAAAVWSNLGSSVLGLILNPIVGSLSDIHGRRPIILLSLLMSSLPSFAFLLILWFPTFNPAWYYVLNVFMGAANFSSISFAYLGDCVTQEYLAGSFGMFMAVFMGGWSLAASIPVYFSAFHVAILSVILIILAFLSAWLFLPESLPESDPEDNIHRNLERPGPAELMAYSSRSKGVLNMLTKPIREISILNRSWTLRIIAIGSFFGSMVFAADSTLIVYYLEEELDVRNSDIASLFLILGVTGIFVQAGLMQPLVSHMGEKGTLVMAFICGTVHNVLYGTARTKERIYFAFIICQFTHLGFPLLSSIAAKNVGRSEQGRIQGALFATNSIALSLGPLSMELVYRTTKNKPAFGPGFMFIYAAMLYAVGTVFVSIIPRKDVCDDVLTAPLLSTGSEVGAYNPDPHDAASLHVDAIEPLQQEP